MVQYLVTYSIQTGKEQDHDRWLHDIGIKYFQNQEGFQGFRSYSTLVGSGPDWVLEIDFDSSENLMKALESDHARAMLEDFEKLVTDLYTKILTPTTRPIGR
jgi:antibiotic biosynthesis monooxygenase (ABM) superfamily enzyme